jgi:hypothetical protein
MPRTPGPMGICLFHVVVLFLNSYTQSSLFVTTVSQIIIPIPDDDYVMHRRALIPHENESIGIKSLKGRNREWLSRVPARTTTDSNELSQLIECHNEDPTRSEKKFR